MRSIALTIALAACVAVPAQAQDVSVRVRADAGGVGVYFDAMEAGVPAPWLYEQSASRYGQRVLPARGTFAYFGSRSATYAAVVTDVWPDGTVTLEHATPIGRMSFRMNLEHPWAHQRRGAIVNDYVSFMGPPRLASRAFYGYAAPPPRTVVVHRIHSHGGHRGHVGPRVYRDAPRSACAPGNNGRGHAYGLCGKKGRSRDVVVVHHDHHHGDYGDHGDHGDHKHKKKKNKKHKKNKHKKGKRHDDRRASHGTAVAYRR